RPIAEPRIIHQVSKRFQTHVTGPDGRVAIDVAAAVPTTVMQMPDAEPIEAHPPGQPVDRFIVLRGGTQGIARGENMASIAADTQALRAPYAVEDAAELLEAVAQVGPLAGGRLSR